MLNIRNLVAAFVVVIAAPAMSDDAPKKFDVAEDLSRFIFAQAPQHGDGMPAFGNAFVTQGYIYPAGTLDGGVEGTNPDGSPVWPEKVLGTWTCDGYFVGDGGHTTTGNMVITRQIFQFKDGSIVVTHGPELADVHVAIDRPITGATGKYLNAGDVMEQTLLGMSNGYGVRLQFEIEPDDEQAAWTIQQYLDHI